MSSLGLCVTRMDNFNDKKYTNENFKRPFK